MGWDIDYSSRGPNANVFVMSNEKDGRRLFFPESDIGLYAWDGGAADEHHVVNVATLADKRNNYHYHDYSRAAELRRFQRIVGFESNRSVVKAIDASASGETITGLPFDRNDPALAKEIFGGDVHALQGKTPQRRPRKVLTKPVPIPHEYLYLLKKCLVLSVDVMKVYGLPFS